MRDAPPGRSARPSPNGHNGEQEDPHLLANEEAEDDPQGHGLEDVPRGDRTERDAGVRQREERHDAKRNPRAKRIDESDKGRLQFLEWPPVFHALGIFPNRVGGPSFPRGHEQSEDHAAQRGLNSGPV